MNRIFALSLFLTKVLEVLNLETQLLRLEFAKTSFIFQINTPKLIETESCTNVTSRLEFAKTGFIFLINTPKFIKTESSTNVMLKLESSKTSFIFQINTPKFIKIESFKQKKEKNFKFGTKNTSFRYFWAANSKNYYHIQNQRSRFFQNAELHPR